MLKRLAPFLGLLLLACCFTSCDPETEGVTITEPVEIDGSNFFTLNGQERALNYAYSTMPASPQGPRSFHHIVLTSHDVERNGRLSGTSDMLGFYIQAETEEILEGSYEVDWSGQRDSPIMHGIYCENMNFTTGSADDDVPTATGTLTIAKEDDDMVLVLDFSLQDGRTLTGQFTGPLKEVNQ